MVLFWYFRYPANDSFSPSSIMASLTGGVYPPDINPEEQQHLIDTIKDWTIGNGLAIRPPPTVIPTEADPTGVAAVSAPVTVFPSPFPRVCFEQGRVVQQSYNELYAAVSRDEEFISEMVKEYDLPSLAKALLGLWLT